MKFWVLGFSDLARITGFRGHWDFGLEKMLKHGASVSVMCSDLDTIQASRGSLLTPGDSQSSAFA